MNAHHPRDDRLPNSLLAGRVWADEGAKGEIVKADQAREQRIQELGVKLCVADTVEERIALWSQLRAEIAKRSPAQVQRMEWAKGLR